MFDDLLDRYGTLLAEVDGWFNECLQRHPEFIRCSAGCSECCRGLFDITMLDACYLRKGIDQLIQEQQRHLQNHAQRRLHQLTTLNSAFTFPWTLNHLPESDWDNLMPEEDETPCILLGEDGCCLVYQHRPMTCRLNGIPLFDVSGEPFFDDYCTLNFTGIDPHAIWQSLQHPFYDLFNQELLLDRELTRRLSGYAVSELDTVIPAAITMDSEQLEAIKKHLSFRRDTND